MTDLINHIVDISVGELVYGGAAMGRLADGRAVFVSFALPGEVVRARITQEKRGHALAELVEVIHPSPERIQPRCRHFGACGGCHYQTLDYPRQLEAKQAILRDQLQRIGAIQSPPVTSTVASPEPWFYRNHVQLHLAPGSQVGYQAPDSHTVIPIQECFLPEKPLNDLWPLLDLEAIPGLERVGLRLGAGDNPMIVLEGHSGEPPELSVDLPVSVVYLDDQGAVVLAGDEALIMEVRGRLFRVSPGAFFQVNSSVAGLMVDYLLAHLPLSPDGVVWDVYCGVGLFSAFLAPRVKHLVGIEISPPACQDFAVNLDEFEQVDLYEGAAEAILPGLPGRPDGVLVDPPRSGLEKPVIDAILNAMPAWIAYVSCDPATLARDLRRFIQVGYRLESVTPFDMFPQTYHIESISLLRR